MIELKHLCKKYENATPFSDINAVINDGDIICVIGPSGTGKSTLLRCINMLESPTSGQIIINGVDITAPGCDLNEIRKKVGMVFQSFNLFDHYTVIENVMQAPIDLLGKSRQEAYNKAKELLHMVGMDGRAFQYPEALSGGQKQRVAIARTLAMDPDIILFDEPTSALDPTMVGEVQSVIRELAEMGKSMMIVTHEMQFAREICNRVFYMDMGGIYEDGTADQVFNNPKGERTRCFINNLKLCDLQIDTKEYDFLGAVSELEQYGYKYRIPPKTLYCIQSVFEELCQQLIMPKLKDPKMEFTVEYNEATERASVILVYNGDHYDPRQSDNTLSLDILNRRVESMEYEEIESDGYTNRLTMQIR